MKKKTAFLLVLVLMIFSGGCHPEKEMKINIETVENLDLQRYLGKWYEIARFDHRFERGMVGVTATYSMMDDGTIKVINEGFDHAFEGKHRFAEGKAKKTDEPGVLKVSFFWIFYAQYRVLELDENYQWALIGSSSENYLWILNRTPQLEEHTKNLILKKAEKRGYDISKLIWVKQKTE